ncbi:RNA polymerase sigma-70 factor [Desertivirga xinjiangensis]|uniref:RNA polymerase sigma-70 factor n=1 Tax=Desertivirga xinjiangensis TaxID=539206 RepID=UPI00210D808E|nr:RNA polymerase sigma-70 factor [Pedobacter xinjiangensis]
MFVTNLNKDNNSEMSLMLDISGFEALFQVNYQSLCASSFRIVQDKDIAEDIVQDVFYRLWEKRDSLIITSSLKAYLFQSTINQSLNYIKKYKNALKREDLYGSETMEDVNDVEQAMALKEVNQRVEAAVKALPEACRMVFILSRYDQLSYKEIASKLDISVKTVEGQMSKALKHLRSWLLTGLSLINLFFF